MSRSVNARIAPHLEQRLADYCAKRGVTRSEAVVQALHQYLESAAGGTSAWALAADLIPEVGVKAVQSDKAREIARKAMSGARAR